MLLINNHSSFQASQLETQFYISVVVTSLKTSSMKMNCKNTKTMEPLRCTSLSQEMDQKRYKLKLVVNPKTKCRMTVLFPS